MKYLKVSEVKSTVNEAGLQISKDALNALDLKVNDFLWKLIRTVRKGRINIEEVNLLKM